MAFSKANPVIARNGASAVTYDLSNATRTTITLPVGSSWSSGLHWHETHDEYLHVVQGSISVRLGQETMILRAGQEAKVPKFVRHEWSRAEIKSGEEVVVIERTEPLDEEKHIFFWNLNGVILRAGNPSGVLGNLLVSLQLFMIFYKLDNWPVLVEMSHVRRFVSGVLAAKLEAIITHSFLAASWKVGCALGYETVDEQFTPTELFRAWRARTELKEK